MNASEALTALYEGKKIKRKVWGGKAPAYYEKKGDKIFTSLGTEIDLFPLSVGDWELYQEKTLNAEQIFEVLGRKGKIKQITWKDNNYHYQLYEGRLWEYRAEKPHREIYELYLLDDIWIEVE